MTRRLPAALLSAALVTGLAGCGGSEKQTETEAKPGGVSTPKVASAKKFKIDESAYRITGDESAMYLKYATLVSNPNANQFGDAATVRITARNAAGDIIGTTTDRVGTLPPGTVVATAGQMDVEEKPASVEFVEGTVDWYDTKTKASDYRTIEAKGVRWVQSYLPDVVGELVNPWPSDIDSVAVVVLYRDESGKLIGGADGYEEGLPANGSLPFKVMDLNGFKSAPPEIEVYARPSDSQTWNDLALGKTATP